MSGTYVSFVHYSPGLGCKAVCPDPQGSELTGDVANVTCPSCREIITSVLRERFRPTVKLKESPKKPEVQNDETHYGFMVRGMVSRQAEAVFALIEPWVDQFNKKNQDYTNSGGAVSENFGILGQYMKLVDKVHKLRKPMWDSEIVRQAMNLGHVTKRAEELNFEDAQEILDDIIGHALLAKLHLKERDA